MKIRTYRKVLIAVQVVVLIVLFNDDKWLPIIFPSAIPTVITISPLAFWCAMLFVPVVLLVFERFFLYNSYKTLTKLGNAFFSAVLVLAVTLPLMFVPARTEITGKSVTKHNVLGNVSKVYEFSEASKVKAELYVYAGRRTNITNLNFIYEVTFDNGHTETFTEFDLEKSWSVVKEIDHTVKSNSIKKVVYGKPLLDSVYDYGGAVGYVGDKVKILMK